MIINTLSHVNPISITTVHNHQDLSNKQTVHTESHITPVQTHTSTIRKTEGHSFEVETYSHVSPVAINALATGSKKRQRDVSSFTNPITTFVHPELHKQHQRIANLTTSIKPIKIKTTIDTEKEILVINGNAWYEVNRSYAYFM